MTTQRKIPHVLASEGQGRDFHYLPVLGVALDLSRPVIVTEKVDGSTMQCQAGVPFKRYDNFKAGDPRKHGASEEDRYRLEACDDAKKHEQHYLAAFRTKLDAFQQMPADVWVYFEAMGSKIGARYGDLAPTVRVFDISDANGWWPWRQTWGACGAAGLPIVADEEVVFGDVETLLARVSVATSRDPELPPHELEGWVLRQGDLVAKIRRNDLARTRSAA